MNVVIDLRACRAGLRSLQASLDSFSLAVQARQSAQLPADPKREDCTHSHCVNQIARPQRGRIGPMVTGPLGLKPSANQDERDDAAAGVSRRGLMEVAAEMPVGRHLQMQMRTLVRDLLDLPCRVAEQLVTKVGQGSRGRDLLPDLRDLLVIGVTAGKAVANHAHAVPGQPGLGPRLPVFLAE